MNKEILLEIEKLHDETNKVKDEIKNIRTTVSQLLRKEQELTKRNKVIDDTLENLVKS